MIKFAQALRLFLETNNIVERNRIGKPIVPKSFVIFCLGIFFSSSTEGGVA